MEISKAQYIKIQSQAGIKGTWYSKYTNISLYKTKYEYMKLLTIHATTKDTPSSAFKNPYRMPQKKCCNPLLIFFRINGASTVHEYATRLHQPIHVQLDVNNVQKELLLSELLQKCQTSNTLGPSAA